MYNANSSGSPGIAVYSKIRKYVGLTSCSIITSCDSIPTPPTRTLSDDDYSGGDDEDDDDNNDDDVMILVVVVGMMMIM